MPNEILALSIMSLIAGTGTLIFVIWIVSEHIKARREVGSSNSSMTTSELESMMLNAARQAVEPLTRRIENLESIAVDESDADLLREADTYYPTESVSDSKIKVTRQGKESL